MRSVVVLILITRINVFTPLEGFALALAFARTQKLSMLGCEDELFKEIQTRRAHTIGQQEIAMFLTEFLSAPVQKST